MVCVLCGRSGFDTINKFVKHVAIEHHQEFLKLLDYDEESGFVKVTGFAHLYTYELQAEALKPTSQPVPC
jgi:hypothetical protein